ncbi:MAG: hypothetical protein R3E97_03125 [Candidatus Eisenbacteria bacterium]
MFAYQSAVPRKLVSAAFLLPLAILAGASTLAGCDDDTVQPEPEESPYLDPTSPANLLDNLIIATELRDAEGYAALFDADQFIFRFDPIDVGDGYPLSWGYAEELAWSNACFASADVFRLSLEWNQGPLQDLDEDDPDLYTDPAMKKMLVTSIHLEIEIENPVDPTDHVIFLVQGDRGRFYFEPDPSRLIDGQPTWKIVEWQDIQVEGSPLPTIRSTFGAIKTVFQPL